MERQIRHESHYIEIFARVVNFLPHPNPPRIRSLGSKKFTNDARIAIDVLRRSKNQKVLQDHHHQLSTYSIGQD
ncbi:RQC domain-containing protein [Microcoleus vaginatus]|uniref:RQC domain-containing protein n=1 Tax=Microcoleus vaginatus TaxID=119532 RepID=UPI0005874F31